MTNAERKTHVIRILGTNKAGDVLPDIWVDVERIDELEIKTQVIQGPGGAVEQYQKVKIKLRWLDDPDQDYDPDANRNRVHRTVKVCDPSQGDLDDPDEFILIKSIELMDVKHGGGSIIKAFKESDPHSDIDSRVIANRRITHWDTSIDDAAQAAFDADPTRKVYVEPDGNRNYERIEDTEDEDQYVEYQIVKKLNRQDSQQLLSTGNDQRRVLYLRNQYLIDESREAKLKELGKDDINPPYRLDPFQNIINVKWAVLNQVVMGLPQTAFGSTPNTISTKDGNEFDPEKFGAGTFSGASGLGKTVIGNGYHLLAFGKPKDGPSCFIMVDGNWYSGTENYIKRGVLDDAGELRWTTIGSFPSSDGNGGKAGAYSLTFCGDRFFIVYPVIADTAGEGDLVHMSTSLDGMEFEHGIDPFPGVNAPSICDPDGKGGGFAGRPSGGSVAYDKKNSRYVTTGSYVRWYEAIFYGHFEEGTDTYDTTAIDENFMSSVSTNGTSWTPKFDQSEGFGVNNYPTNPTRDIGHSSSGTSTICFSDALGLFVASSTYKKNNLNLNNNVVNGPGANTQEFPYFLPASAVATSEDGVSWSNRLVGPEAAVDQYAETQYFAFSYSVTFVKTGPIDNTTGSDGFFLLGTNTTSPFGISTSVAGALAVWRSEDGNGWTKTYTAPKGFAQAMTQINKNASPDKVIYI